MNKQETPQFEIPEELARQAKNLLDNPDFLSIIGSRSKLLMNETMSYSQDNEVLAAHREFKALEDFYEWVQYAAEQL